MDPRYNRPRLRFEEAALLRREAGPLATFKPSPDASGTDVLHDDGLFKPVSGGGLPPGTLGDLLYHDGADWVVLPVGSAGEVVTSNGSIPQWDAAPGGGGDQALSWVV